MAAWRTTLVSAALLCAGGAALAWATDGFQAYTTESARRLAVERRPVPVPDVGLQDQTGARFGFAGLRGRWLLVEFIYTRCRTLCLAQGGEFARLQRLLAEPIAQGRVALLSISFDPAHDTPARLAGYLRTVRARPVGWHAARPDAAGLARLERVFGITVIPDALGGYTHNAAIHLVDPRGRLVAIFGLGQTEAVVQALARRLAG